MRVILCAALVATMGARDLAWPQSAETSLDELAQELARLQQDVQNKNREIGSLLKAYERQGGSLPDGFGPDLSEEQRKLLSQRFQQERLGLKSTLQDILDRDREISVLKRRMTQIDSGGGPTSILARAGDTHMGIVRTFLNKRGVAAAETARLLSQVSLHPTLVAGNRVWIYLRAGILGTWVTAGDSRLNTSTGTSPTSRVAVTGSRDAVKKVRALEVAMAEMERERVVLAKENATLRADIGHWSQQADEARQIARAAVQAARYLAGSKDELRRWGVIAGNWIRGTHVQRLEGLDMLDLTKSSQIVVSAADHGLQRIEKVELLPGGFVHEQDYVVDFFEGGAYARVALLDLDKFKNSAFVVVLE